VQARGRQGEDLDAGLGDADRMLVLRRQRAVARHRCPAILHQRHIAPAEIDHRLDGEDHAGAQFFALPAPAEVEDVRRVVKDAAKPVAAESLDDRVALAFGIFLDRGAKIAKARARLDRLDAASSWTRR
jgi:hypothetical protein